MNKTCGILITDGVRLLICHPTNETRWDIPKGRQESGEDDDMVTAIRETWEETGLKINPDSLTSLGTWPYKPGKLLSLFLYLVIDMPDVSTLTCHTHVTTSNRKFPEMDGYDILPFEQAVLKFNPEMKKIIEGILVEHMRESA
jgi:8-oxo-dGTP pyrophosphatase MutT (NUDIX family)